MTSWNDEWAQLLDALCADDPARIGTVGEPDDDLTPVRPTVFGWLAGFDWWPAAGSTGIALLDLTEPGTVPAAAWEPLCGPLSEAPSTRQGRLLVGRHTPPGAGRSATLTLVTDRSDEGARAHVVAVRIRIEPV
jgi:hypothetical protein